MPSCRKATTRISASSTDRWGKRGDGGWCARPARAVAVSLAVASAWAAVHVATAPAADEADPADKVAIFMRAKLAHSGAVLEGLALGDYDLIARGAQELSLASQDSNWNVLQTEDYVRQSMEFRRACDTLRRAAKERNLDGAALAWMEVTMKCVQCHRSLRDEERGR